MIFFTRMYFLFIFLLLLNYSGKAQWIQTDGPNAGFVECLVAQDSNIFAGTWDGGVFISTNNGISWNNLGLTNLNVFSLQILDSNIFAGTLSGAYRSTNSGISWFPVNSGLTGNFVSSFARIGNNLFAGVYTGAFQGGAFRSTDYGTNWVPVNNGLTWSDVVMLYVVDTILFAGTSHGGIFRSSDMGDNWMDISLPDGYVYCMAAIESDLVAGTLLGSGAYRSTNNGLSWVQANEGLPSTDVRTFAKSDNILFAGLYDGGVFFSTDNGISWRDFNLNLSDFWIYSLLVKNDTLYAGGQSNVWKRPIDQITSVDNFHNLPIEIFLEQNFPNPFNAGTVIKYFIREHASEYL